LIVVLVARKGAGMHLSKNISPALSGPQNPDRLGYERRRVGRSM